MLNRLVTARLKAAQHALESGRLDEAFRLATAPDLLALRQGGRVLEDACLALFDRAEAHFKAGRHTEALNDLRKAEVAGVKVERIHDLRTIVHAAVEDDQRSQQSRRQRLDAAHQRLAEGNLRAAEHILAAASEHDHTAAALREQARDREARARQLLEEVARYAGGDHWAAAVQRFRQARQAHPKDPQVTEWENTLVQRISTSMRRALEQGHIHRAFEEGRLLEGIGDDRSATRETFAIRTVLTAAASALRRGDFEEARRSALRLQHLLPDAAWIRPVCEQLQQLDELATVLHGGPLGLVPSGAEAQCPSPAAGADPTTQQAPSLDETLAAPRSGGSAALPQRLLVLVDGAGSFLLLRQPRSAVGRAIARQPADIPIFADLSERHAEIARVDEDYFLVAKRQVNVGGRNVVEKLLQSGDRIILGKRAKLTFTIPSRKSSTAVLDLGDTVKIPHAVRRIILFDRLATIGRTPVSHMVVPTAGEDLVLFERGGALWIRPQANGRNDEGVQIVLGKPFEMLGVSMVIGHWT